MELFNGMDITNLGFVALATFGAVSAINFWKQLDSKTNFALSIVFAFLFSLVPPDLGSVIGNKIKDAVAVAITLNGAYQFLGGVAKKVTNEKTPPSIT